MQKTLMKMVLLLFNLLDEDACFINIKGDCVFKLKDFTFQPDEQHIEYFPTDNIVRIETLSISDEDDAPVMPTPNDTSIFFERWHQIQQIFLINSLG